MAWCVVMGKMRASAGCKCDRKYKKTLKPTTSSIPNTNPNCIPHNVHICVNSSYVIYVYFCRSEMDCEPELLESSLFYHGTYLLDELHREQQMSSDSELSHWFQSHLPYTIAPKFVFVHLSRCIFDLGELCVYTSLCDVVPSRRAAPSLGYCSSCQPCVQFTHALRSS